MKNSFMNWFDLSVPILQAPIGGAATVSLAKAVGQAGGMGSLAMTWTEEAIGKSHIAALEASRVPFFLNFVLRFGTEGVRRFLRPGLPAITLSWGVDRKVIEMARGMGIKVGVQVGSSVGAMDAIAAGADFIIAQGLEAGGHVQSTTPLAQLLPRVLRVAGSTPVIAAGGIVRAEDIAAALRAGAHAVLMGTRFLASREADAHDFHKQAIVAAGAADWAFTNCFDVDWPHAMHGVLRNSTLEMWEAAGCPAPSHRPGEGEVVAYHGGVPIIRYCDTPPQSNATGDVGACCLYAGKGAQYIDDIAPAADIVKRLWAETQVHL